MKVFLKSIEGYLKGLESLEADVIELLHTTWYNSGENGRVERINCPVENAIKMLFIQAVASLILGSVFVLHLWYK